MKKHVSKKEKKELLLDLKFEVKVSNDGKNNQTSIVVDQEVKVHHIMTALELCMVACNEMFMRMGQYYAPMTTEQASDMIRNTTYGDVAKIFNNQ